MDLNETDAPQPSVVIRPVRADDHSRLEEIRQAAFAPVFASFRTILGGVVVGFVSVQLNRDTRVGEIGLNAVHPDHAGKGIGTAMYDFAMARMKVVGMRAATVATVGDPSHAPARRAYEKAGFTAQIPSVWLCRKL